MLTANFVYLKSLLLKINVSVFFHQSQYISATVAMKSQTIKTINSLIISLAKPPNYIYIKKNNTMA